MKTNFLYSNTFKGAGELVTERLKSRDKSHRSIVIVPDRFVLATERSILDGIGEAGSFDIEIVSFTRLAKLVLKQMNMKYLSRDVATMLMRKVVEEHRDDLKCYAKCVGTVGFPNEIYSAMGNLRNNCIPADTLQAKVSELPEGIRNKLNDLFTLYDGYISALGDKYADNDTLMEKLSKAIPDIPDITNCDVYFMEYFYFTVEQREVIRAFMSNAHEVNIALIMDNGTPNARLYPHTLDSILKDMCREVGVEYTTCYREDKLPKPMTTMLERLYSYSIGNAVSAENMIEIHEADDINTEVEDLALSIFNIVKSGVRYKHIGVAISKPDSYLPTIERVFGMYGIPYFADVRKPLIVEPISRFILDYLSLICEPSVKALISIAKNVFSGIEYTNVERLENYCLKYAITYADISKPFTLGKGDANLGISRDINYDIAESTRYQVYSRFARVQYSDIKTISDVVSLVKDMLVSHDIESKCEDFGAKLKTLGRDTDEATNKTAYNTILTILDDMDSVMGGNSATIEDFAKLFEGTASATEIGAVPTYIDSVYVGNCRESRYMGVSHLYVVGADADNFPMTNEDKGIISSREAKELAKIGVHLEPDIGRRNVEEKLYALQLLIKPTAKLHISYNTYNGKKPSSAIGELNNIFSDILFSRSYDILTSDNGISRMVNSNVARDIAVEGVSRYVNDEAKRDESIACITAYNMLANEDITRAMYHRDDVVVKDEYGDDIDMFPKGHTSPSQVESYFRCPYNHFLQYALSLKERDSDVKPNLSGTFIHDFLENFVGNYSNIGASDNEIKAYANDLFDTLIKKEEYVFFLEENRAVSLKRLRNECERLAVLIISQISNCDYKPYEVEKKIGEQETTAHYEKSTSAPQNNALYVERASGKLNFTGTIDRIDANGENSIIIDYKTGKAGGSISDVYYGRKVQVYLYAKALSEGEHKTINGVYYYPIHDTYDKDGKGDTTGQMIGQMLDNIDFIKSMDKTLQPTTKSEYIGIALKQDGCVKRVRGIDNKLLSREELDRLMQYAYDVTANAVREIDEGIIYKSPNDSGACDKCKYRDICIPKGDLVRECKSIEKEVITVSQDTKEAGDNE